MTWSWTMFYFLGVALTAMGVISKSPSDWARALWMGLWWPFYVILSAIGVTWFFLGAAFILCWYIIGLLDEGRKWILSNLSDLLERKG